MDPQPTMPSCGRGDSRCSRTRRAKAARTPRCSTGATRGSWPVFDQHIAQLECENLNLQFHGPNKSVVRV